MSSPAAIAPSGAGATAIVTATATATAIELCIEKLHTMDCNSIPEQKVEEM